MTAAEFATYNAGVEAARAAYDTDPLAASTCARCRQGVHGRCGRTEQGREECACDDERHEVGT